MSMFVSFPTVGMRPAENAVAELINAILNAPLMVEAHVRSKHKGLTVCRVEQCHSVYAKVATFLPEGGGYATFLHGKVVDMFYFPMIKGNYPDWFRDGASFIFFRPVFNIADSSISIAVAIILFNQRRFFRHVAEAESSEAETSEAETNEA